MSDKNNATCAICGKGYVMCYSCDKGDVSKHWKLHCDTPEHYKIFQIIHGYTSGVYTKAEAAKKLDKVDLSDFDELRDNIKEVVNDIRGSKKKAERKIKTVNVSHEKMEAANTPTLNPVVPVSDEKPDIDGKLVYDNETMYKQE